MLRWLHNRGNLASVRFREAGKDQARDVEGCPNVTYHHHQLQD